MKDEVAEGLKIARAALESFEAKIAAGAEDPAAVMVTIKRIVGALLEHNRPSRQSKKPIRGAGFDEETAWMDGFLMINGGSVRAAAQALRPNASPEWHESVARRYREHRKQVEEAGGYDGGLSDD